MEIHVEWKRGELVRSNPRFLLFRVFWQIWSRIPVWTIEGYMAIFTSKSCSTFFDGNPQDRQVFVIHGVKKSDEFSAQSETVFPTSLEHIPISLKYSAGKRINPAILYLQSWHNSWQLIDQLCHRNCKRSHQYLTIFLSFGLRPTLIGYFYCRIYPNTSKSNDISSLFKMPEVQEKWIQFRVPAGVYAGIQRFVVIHQIGLGLMRKSRHSSLSRVEYYKVGPQLYFFATLP